MSTTIRVRNSTKDALKSFQDEPYDFTSLDEVICFLTRKEQLFELVVNANPNILEMIRKVEREEKIKTLEEKLQALKENRPQKIGRVYKIQINDVDLGLVTER